MDVQKEKLKEIALWLESKNISLKCPQCGSEHMEYFNQFATMYTSPMIIPVIPNSNQGLTMVVLGCLNCAFMRFFSAQIMGATPSSSKSIDPDV